MRNIPRTISRAAVRTASLNTGDDTTFSSVDSPPLPDGTVVRGTGILRCDGGTGVGSGVGAGGAGGAACGKKKKKKPAKLLKLKPLLHLLWPEAELTWGDSSLLPDALVRDGQALCH